MAAPSNFDIRAEVAATLREGGAVVALESTLIAHGLPWPTNLQTARAAEAAVRAEGAVLATIAVLNGRPTVGLIDAESELLARSQGVLKASRRDLATAVARGLTAGTTVAATMFLAHRAGIAVLATGGIGGAHRGAEHTADVSADLWELARVPVAVVCAGAKSILDIPRTLEILETLSVPVVGYRTDSFPAFYVPSSGQPVSVRAESPAEAAGLVRTHWSFSGSALVIAQPLPPDNALTPAELDAALARAEQAAQDQSVQGPQLTPFLLARLAEFTAGKSLRANQDLIVANATLAAQIGRILGS